MQGFQPDLLSTADELAELYSTEYQLQQIHGSAGNNTEENKNNNQRAMKCPIGVV